MIGFTKEMAKPSLNIDLSDKGAIKESLPEVRRFVESKQQAVDAAEKAVLEARRELAEWGRLLDQLCVLAGVKTPEARPTKKRPERKPSIQQQVIEIVNSSLRPLTTMDVALAIGPEANRDTVNYSLWQAARNEKIKRVSQGRYAPLTYEPTDEELLLSDNGGGKN